MIYTVIIDPDGSPDFEDFENMNDAISRIKELGKQGIEAVLGWTGG